MYEVRRLGPGDVPATGAVLGRAFRDNPAYRALLRHMSDAQRAEAVGRIKRGFATAAVKCQEAQGVWMDGRLAGASLVCAPGQYPHGISAFLSHALGCTRTGWRGIVNLLRADAYITRRHVRGEHYYLFVLGVDPDFQRRGVGRRLLDELNARADAAGLPCYLETDKPTSVELYRSVGYEVCTEEDVPGVPGMHMWTMLRPGSHSTHTSVLPNLAT